MRRPSLGAWLIGLALCAGCVPPRSPVTPVEVPPPTSPPPPAPVPCLPMGPPAPDPDPRPPDLRHGDEAYDRGDLAAAAAAYEAFLASPLADRAVDRVLARLVVLCSLSPTRDPIAAREYHQRLVAEYPNSPYRAEADFVMRSNGELEQQKKRTQELEREVARLRQVLEKLKEIDLAPRKPPR